MPSFPGSIASWSDKTDGIDWPVAADVNQANDEVVAIETELGTDPAGSVATVKARLAQSMDGVGNLDFATSTELTISTGSVTPTQNWHTIDTEGDAASDDLDTIVASALTDGFRLYIRANNTARTVVIKHNTGNIVTFNALDITLDETYKFITLIYDVTLAKWIVGGPVNTSLATTAAAGLMPTLDNDATHFFSGAGTQIVTPYPLPFFCGGFSPADGAVIYIGQSATASVTTAAVRKVFFPRAGTVTRIDLKFVNGVVGDSATSTISFRLNNTTDTAISSAVNNSTATQVINLTSISVAVVAGDYFEIKWACPTWGTTNPTSVDISGIVWIT
jgi:hypothetical protein